MPTKVTKERWIAELAVLGREDREKYRRIRALLWELISQRKRERFPAGLKNSN
jgi:hypothetical protein